MRVHVMLTTPVDLHIDDDEILDLRTDLMLADINSRRS